MEFIPSDEDLASSTQIHTLVQPFRMACAFMHAHALVFNESLQGLAQQLKNGVVLFRCNHLCSEQGGYGKR